MDKQETTFWNLLKQHPVEIPIIQRDYAQGRLGKENLRKGFLTDLKQALVDEKPLKLDFIYGSVENGRMQPLDGQQRLTTLWLLHWYCALKADKLNDSAETLKHFGYETRLSSREFCEQLCWPANFVNYSEGSVVDYIKKTTWFYAAWKQDPTIQSMLRMLKGTKINDDKSHDILDGIEELFEGSTRQDFDTYWQRLTADNCTIVFYYKELKDFGLSDDLYIKMNARGKPLTSFENFKADLVGYAEHKVENADNEEERSRWQAALDPQEGFPVKFDTKWIDTLFWDNKSKGMMDDKRKIVRNNQIDEIFFTFLNRFFWNELFVAKKADGSYVLDLGKDDSSTQEKDNASYCYLNGDMKKHNRNAQYETIAYEGVDIYKYHNGEIPLAVFEKLTKVLDNCSNSIPGCGWDKDFCFIPAYAEENGYNKIVENDSGDSILAVPSINQSQRIVFFAFCKYFAEGKADADSLRRWTRVVWNLVSAEDEDDRPIIRSTTAIRTAIEFVDSLDSHDVYQSLTEQKPTGTSAFDKKCQEEYHKAVKILSDADWEQKIVEAENFASFNGSISCLFTNENGEVDWDDFDTKLQHLLQLIVKDSQKDDFVLTESYRNDAKALKLVLSYCDGDKSWTDQIESRTHSNHYLFSTSFKHCWKNHILLNPLYRKPVHKLLTGCDTLGAGPQDLYDDWRRSAYDKLMNTNIISLCYDDIHHMDHYYIRWIYDNLCLYPSSEGYILSLPQRDAILRQWLDDGKATLCYHDWNNIPGYPGFRGWGVCFTYNRHKYEWLSDNQIYLLNRNNECEMKGGDYCRIIVDNTDTSDTLLQKLDELAAQE